MIRSQTLTRGHADEFIAQSGLRAPPTWFHELVMGGAACAAGGVAAHLTSCVALPLLITSALSSTNIYVDGGNLVLGVLARAPDTWITRSIAAYDAADTLCKSALTAIFCSAGYSLLYNWRLKMRPKSIRRANAIMFLAGAVTSTLFNIGAYIENKEAYAAFRDKDYSTIVDLPLGVRSNFLAWQAYTAESSCIRPRRPHETWLTYAGVTALHAGTAIGDGATALFNGRLSKALNL